LCNQLAEPSAFLGALGHRGIAVASARDLKGFADLSGRKAPAEETLPSQAYDLHIGVYDFSEIERIEIGKEGLMLFLPGRKDIPYLFPPPFPLFAMEVSRRKKIGSSASLFLFVFFPVGILVLFGHGSFIKRT